MLRLSSTDSPSFSASINNSQWYDERTKLHQLAHLFFSSRKPQSQSFTSNGREQQTLRRGSLEPAVVPPSSPWVRILLTSVSTLPYFLIRSVRSGTTKPSTFSVEYLPPHRRVLLVILQRAAGSSSGAISARRMKLANSTPRGPT